MKQRLIFHRTGFGSERRINQLLIDSVHLPSLPFWVLDQPSARSGLEPLLPSIHANRSPTTLPVTVAAASYGVPQGSGTIRSFSKDVQCETSTSVRLIRSARSKLSDPRSGADEAETNRWGAVNEEHPPSSSSWTAGKPADTHEGFPRY